jgi:SAM-dependent methyltransferase
MRHPAIGKGSEASVTDSLGRSRGGLFTGTAWHYARYRPGYPQVFFDDVVQRFHLDGTGRLLDLGCGTGQLTLPLAEHVTEAVGMDPSPKDTGPLTLRARASTGLRIRPPMDARTGHRLPLLDLTAVSSDPWRQADGLRKAISSALLAIDPNGQFAEPVTLEVFAATRG